MRLDRKSDAQANAEAQRTYADEHARSWQVRMDRPSREPSSLRELVRDLRRAYADEMPTRMHTHDVDGGGTPAYAPEFARHLFGSARGTVADGSLEVYLTPFAAALDGMHRAQDEGTRHRAAIVVHVVLTGVGPIEAARMEDVPEWCAKDVATRALSVFWRRLCDVRLDLGRSTTAA